MTWPCRMLLALGLTLRLLSGAALADPSPVLPAAEVEAENAKRRNYKQLYQAGQDALGNKRYAEAVTKLRGAYKLIPDPHLLWSIGTAQLELARGALLPKTAMDLATEALRTLQEAERDFRAGRSAAPVDPQTYARLAEHQELCLALIQRLDADSKRPPPRPWYRDWRVWTGVGAGVVVVVGTTLAITLTRPHVDTWDFPLNGVAP